MNWIEGVTSLFSRGQSRQRRLWEKAEDAGHRGLALIQAERWDEARGALETAWHAVREAEGDAEGLESARVLNNLANVCRIRGEWEHALTYSRRVWDLKQTHLGATHPETLAALQNLIAIQEQRGDGPAVIASARHLLDARLSDLNPASPQALAAREQWLRTARQWNHPDTNANTNATKNDAAMRQLLSEVSATAAQWPAQREYAELLERLAEFAQTRKDPGTAETLLRFALGQRERIQGRRTVEVAAILNRLAVLALNRGQTALAERLLRETLDIRQQILGSEEIATIDAWNNLASVLFARDQFPEARWIFERVAEMRLQSLGADHPAYLHALSNQAGAAWAAGDPVAARAAFERVRAQPCAQIGDQHPFRQGALATLGRLALTLGDWEEAGAVWSQLREIRTATLGPGHRETLAACELLALAREGQHRRDEAVALREQALALRKANHGERNTAFFVALQDLAYVLQARGQTGDAPRALALFRRALKLAVESLGEAHPVIPLLWTRLSWLLALQGHNPAQPQSQADRTLAFQAAQRGLSPAADGLTAGLPFWSRETVAPLLRSARTALSVVIRQSLGQGPKAAALALQHFFTWRGLVPALDDARSRIRNSPALRADHLRWLRLWSPGDAEDADRNADVFALRLELQNTMSAAVGWQFAGPTLATVQRALAPGTAWIGYVMIDADAVTFSGSGEIGVARYAAFLVRPESSRPPVLTDLGPCPPIDETLLTLRQALLSPTSDPTASGCALAQAIWAPLTPHLQGITHVLITPIGALNDVAFAALPDPDAPGMFLAERMACAFAPPPRLWPFTGTSPLRRDILVTGAVSPRDRMPGTNSDPTQTYGDDNSGANANMHDDAEEHTIHPAATQALGPLGCADRIPSSVTADTLPALTDRADDQTENVNHMRDALCALLTNAEAEHPAGRDPERTGRLECLTGPSLTGDRLRESLRGKGLACLSPPILAAWTLLEKTQAGYGNGYGGGTDVTFSPWPAHDGDAARARCLRAMWMTSGASTPPRRPMTQWPVWESVLLPTCALPSDLLEGCQGVILTAVPQADPTHIAMLPEAHPSQSESLVSLASALMAGDLHQRGALTVLAATSPSSLSSSSFREPSLLGDYLQSWWNRGEPAATALQTAQCAWLRTERARASSGKTHPYYWSGWRLSVLPLAAATDERPRP